MGKGVVVLNLWVSIREIAQLGAAWVTFQWWQSPVLGALA